MDRAIIYKPRSSARISSCKAGPPHQAPLRSTQVRIETKRYDVCMAKAIVAIGGGEIRTRGTADIDREIIRLSDKAHPSILFVPTASSDSERYWKHFEEYFGKFLQCKPDVFFLVNEPPSAQQ